MALVRKSFATGFSSNTSRVSGTFSPAGTPALGNFLFAVLVLTNAQDAGANITPPSGWTKLKEINQTGDNTRGVYYKVAGGSEPSTYTFMWTDPDFKAESLFVAEWSGNDTVTPIDVSAAAWQDTFTAGPISVTAITTVTDNAVDIVIVGQNDSTGYALAGYTEEQDGNGIAVYSKVITPAGSTGARSVTLPTNSYTAAYSFAIRPSGGAAAPAVVQRPRSRPFPFTPGSPRS